MNSAGASGAACDDIDDYSAPDTIMHGPAKALAAAQDQEHARVTLGRAMHSLLHMLDVRGYTVTFVGEHSTKDVDPYVAAKEFDVADRATLAETDHEIIIEAEVQTHKPYTTSWAQETPIGTKVIVVIITKGNVGVMREVMKTNSKHVILVSRYALTPYSKKWIAECKEANIEFFLLSSLQGTIDKHKLVPRHMPLNAQLSERVKSRYKNAKFPRLLQTDPMVQYLGLTPGMVVSAYERFGREQAALTFFEVVDM